MATDTHNRRIEVNIENKVRGRAEKCEGAVGAMHLYIGGVCKADINSLLRARDLVLDFGSVS